MLYYLFQYLDTMDFPGAGMFQYISFRSAIAVITSLFFSLLVGKKIIRRLQVLQIGEEIRNLGLEGQMQKRGTPTMGGVIILLSILIPVILFGDIKNIFLVGQRKIIGLPGCQPVSFAQDLLGFFNCQVD